MFRCPTAATRRRSVGWSERDDFFRTSVTVMSSFRSRRDGSSTHPIPQDRTMVPSRTACFSAMDGIHDKLGASARDAYSIDDHRSVHLLTDIIEVDILEWWSTRVTWKVTRRWDGRTVALRKQSQRPGRVCPVITLGQVIQNAIGGGSRRRCTWRGGSVEPSAPSWRLQAAMTTTGTSIEVYNF
jgi:hypothetical protein